MTLNSMCLNLYLFCLVLTLSLSSPDIPLNFDGSYKNINPMDVPALRMCSMLAGSVEILRGKYLVYFLDQYIRTILV